jgi:hypothetical protein
MINEWLQIIVMAVGGVLFAAGGTDIPGIGGQKWLRRIVLPLFFAFICVLSHVVWWKCVLLGSFLFVALSLGYGSRTPYWKKALVFSTYGLSFLVIGWSIWVVLTPVLCFSLFCLSNWKPVAQWFWWKQIEFFYGLFLSITLISALSNRI